MSVRILSLITAAAILGCSTATTSGSSPASLSNRRGNLLLASEIASTHADITTAYDAVARLRPNWLAPHGVTSGQNNGAGTEYAVVFLDGQQYGDLNSLRSIPAYHVGEIHYYNMTESGARFGIRGGSSGVIEVMTKTPGSGS